MKRRHSQEDKRKSPSAAGQQSDGPSSNEQSKEQ
jgi:hypothetical protein